MKKHKEGKHDSLDAFSAQQRASIDRKTNDLRYFPPHWQEQQKQIEQVKKEQKEK